MFLNIFNDLTNYCACDDLCDEIILTWFGGLKHETENQIISLVRQDLLS